MKHPFKSEAASEARCRLCLSLENALLRGDVPAALVYAAELRRLGIEVHVAADGVPDERGADREC